MKNTGKEPHQTQLFRLKEGTTVEQLTQMLSNPQLDVRELEKVAVAMGGPAGISAGKSVTVTENLTPGTYAAYCFVAGADGVPHLAKGMVKQFMVTDSGEEPAAPPERDGDVKLADFSIDLPEDFDSGSGTYRIVNDGPAAHEASLLKLAPGVTVETLKQAFQATAAPSGPPPFEEAGGFGAISKGQAGYLDLDLEPGDYAAVCFVPDAEKGGIPHAAEGMLTGFKVS